MEEGHGYIAMHAAMAFLQDWPWLHAMVVQPYYKHNGSGTMAELNKDPDIEKAPDLERIWADLRDPGFISDEWYAFRGNPRTVKEWKTV